MTVKVFLTVLIEWNFLLQDFFVCVLSVTLLKVKLIFIKCRIYVVID